MEGPLEARNLRPNTNRLLKNEKFTPKETNRLSNLCPNINRPLKNEKFTPKGTTRPSNLHLDTNRPLKNEHFMPKTQIVIHDSHNHTRFAKANTQDSCKHARIQNITTHDSHKKKNKKKNTHTHKTYIKHQINLWSWKITKGWTQQRRRQTNITKHANTQESKQDGPKAQHKTRMGLRPDAKQGSA